MNAPGTRVYRAFHGESLGRDGVYVGTYYGVVSACGEWVDCGETRHRLTPAWHEHARVAEAAEAEWIERMGYRLIEQARRLREAAHQQQEVVA